MKSSVKRVEIPVSSFTGAVFKSYPAVSESINFKVKNGVLTDTQSEVYRGESILFASFEELHN